MLKQIWNWLKEIEIEVNPDAPYFCPECLRGYREMQETPCCAVWTSPSK